jgi:hypothetical protein
MSRISQPIDSYKRCNPLFVGGRYVCSPWELNENLGEKTGDLAYHSKTSNMIYNLYKFLNK